VIRRALISGFAAALLLIALRAGAMTAEEHASHHPGGGEAAPAEAPAMAPSAPMAAPAAPPGAPATAGSGMGGMMGKMMAPANPGAAASAPSAAGPSAAGAMTGTVAPASPGGCMGGGCGSSAAKTPIYSSLMTLPALTPEKRAEIEALASQQISEGEERLSTGSESLKRATQAGDYVAMEQSIGTMREALDELGAGIAARRVLAEGKAPRNLALDWFKREMNLASPISSEEPHALLGDTAWHLFMMVLLIAFALVMVAMYFFKMRRAAALFGRLGPDVNPPPPGSSPPLAGAPSPSSPAAPPAGAAPPPAAPASSATSSAVSEATSAAPVTKNWRGQLRVGSIVTETPSVKTFRLVPASNDRFLPFTFVPGQFLNVSFGIGGARMNRSYSISSSPTPREYVELTVRREPRGAVSRHIDDLLKVGDQIDAGGPVGKFTFTGTEADSIVLIAGGVGITPMMSITRYLTERSWAGDIFFVYACRAPTDFIFANEIAALQRVNPKLRVAVTMSRSEGTNWKGPRGRITKELLMQTVPNLASRRIHLCGPPAMMESTKAILTELGVAPDKVKTELFGLTKPSPSAAGTTAKSTALATGPLVTFSKNNKSAKIRIDLQAGDSPPKQSILELSEELGIGIEFSCRVGTCGVCKVKMTSGEVEMAVQDALEPEDKANGIILACQAKPQSAVTVEA
jgi:ferredoxin-NADP reductase